jgi:hypothetical protein
VPNVLHLTVENPDEILNSGAYAAGAVMRVQSSTTEAGVFADISGTGSTPTIAVVTLQRAYTGYDPGGTSSTWYRTRFENAGGTRLSDWTAAFQVGDETEGLLCSLYDVKQALGSTVAATADDEQIIDDIRAVTRFIESHCGRWFVPRPLSGDDTILFDVECSDNVLWVPKGVRSITTLGLATSDQPDSGGSYTTVTDYLLRPTEMDRSVGWPYTRIEFPWSSSNYFTAGHNTVSITGAFGFSEVPPDISRIGVTLVVALHREAGSSGGDTVTITLGGDRVYERALSHRDRMTLDWYRQIVVA